MTKFSKKKRVALVHDFLVQDGGAERVLRTLADMFPEAPIYTLVADFSKAAGRFDRKRIRTSFLQRYPFSIKKYQWYLALMPRAIESFNLNEYDIVISSASAFAKGVITGSDTLHICYCHTPTRYLWTDTHEYLKELRIPRIIKFFLPRLLSKLRVWDVLAANRPDVFIANSKNVQNRIKKYYRRPSLIVYPPIAVPMDSSRKQKSLNFLAGGRIVAYKRFDIVIEAFNKLKIPIKIFGTGPMLTTLRSRAKSNITFLEWVEEDELQKLYSEAKGFINPQEEDFGITMVESLTFGCPVIAYNRGGAQEIVVDGVNGILFDDQSWESLADAVVRFRKREFDKKDITTSANKFNTETFKKKIMEVLHEHEKEF